MIKRLIEVANRLDKKGFLKDADKLDKIIAKLAEKKVKEESDRESDKLKDNKDD